MDWMAFLGNDQLYGVYGLEPTVAEQAMLRFQVQGAPSVVKADVNTANAKGLSRLVHIKSSLASNIVEYRDKNGLFASLQELGRVDGFPKEKLDRIALYLSL